MNSPVPSFQSQDRTSNQQNSVQNKALSDLSKNPTANAGILTSIALKTGTNSINHKLGKTLSGWSIVRQRSAATFFDTQDSNKTPTLTLDITSSADVTVDIQVF